MASHIYEISDDIYTRENDEKYVAHKMVSKFKAILTRNLYAFLLSQREVK